jgi:hypothetical protein
MYVRLRYPGHAALLGATSSRLLLRLRPVVELERPPGRARVRRRVYVEGSVAPRKRTVHLVLQQRVKGRFRKVGAQRVRVRKGEFEGSFVPAFRALYRYQVVAKSDDDTDRAATEWRLLRAQ